MTLLYRFGWSFIALLFHYLKGRGLFYTHFLCNDRTTAYILSFSELGLRVCDQARVLKGDSEASLLGTAVVAFTTRKSVVYANSLTDFMNDEDIKLVQLE